MTPKVSAVSGIAESLNTANTKKKAGAEQSAPAREKKKMIRDILRESGKARYESNTISAMKFHIASLRKYLDRHPHDMGTWSDLNRMNIRLEEMLKKY
jgi:ribosomal protein S15P/S13E